MNICPRIPDYIDGIKLFLSRKKSKYHRKLKSKSLNSNPKILDDTSRRQKSVAIQVQPQMRSRDPQTHIRTLNQSTQVYIPDGTNKSHSGSIMTNRQGEEVKFAEPQGRGEHSISTRRVGSHSDYGEESEPPRHVRYTGFVCF